jgi:predicted O-methyltransferase YrrM
MNLQGVQWCLDRQLDWLTKICGPYYEEVRGLAFYDNASSAGWGPGFGAVESQVLHCVVRSLCPRRILEIGSGVSTACMLDAVKRNEQEGRPGTKITCIEPHPRPAFQSLQGVRLMRELCQVVPKDAFDELDRGDLLFIDSSHSVKVGSDVLKIYLEIIPNLAPGVIIHIHDVYLPFLYPRDALETFFGWQETSLLAALMTNNSRLSALACLSALHYDRQIELRALLTDYMPQADEQGLSVNGNKLQEHFPASLWLQTS